MSTTGESTAIAEGTYGAPDPYGCDGGYIGRGCRDIYARVACGNGAMAGATIAFTSPRNVDASRRTLPSGIVQETNVARMPLASPEPVAQPKSATLAATFDEDV